jgi:peptide/nickel transport system permease protein
VTSFLLRRLALVLPTLFFVSVLVFGLQQLLPGDAALALAGEERDPAVAAFLRQKYHLDDPLPARYLRWVKGVPAGDLGESIRIKRPAPWMAVWPGLAIFGLVLSFNLPGDGLGDALDPHRG